MKTIKARLNRATKDIGLFPNWKLRLGLATSVLALGIVSILFVSSAKLAAYDGVGEGTSVPGIGIEFAPQGAAPLSVPISGTVATINLNNYSAQPIFYLNSGTLLPMAGAYVQLLGGASESSLAAVPAITPQQPSVFSLSEAGYFYGGTGVVPGVTPGALGYFQVRVWRNAVSFETATERGISTVFTQRTGSWASNATPPTPPTGPDLNMPSVIVSNTPLPPTITQQPQSQIVLVNSTVTLSVTVSGSGTFSYQWYQDGTLLSGKTQSTLTYNAVQASQAGVYTVSIANAAGKATSQPAVLIVNPSPIALKNPVATVALNNVDADRPIYYVNAGALLPVAGSFVQLLGGPSESALTPVISLSPDQSSILPLAMEGYFYGSAGMVSGVAPGGLAYFQVRVWRNAIDFESALERGASPVFSQITGSWNPVAVPPSPPVGPTLRLPSSITVYRYSGYTLALSSDPAGMGTIAANSAPGADGAYAPGTVLNLTANAAAGYSFSYWSGHVPAGSEKQNPLSGIKMDRNMSLVAHFLTSLQITTQPIGQTVNEGSDVRFTVVASGSGTLSYRWYHNGEALVDNFKVQGSTSASLLLLAVQTSDRGLYQVKVTSGQTTLTSDPANLLVWAPANLVVGKSSGGQVLLNLEGMPEQAYVIESTADFRLWTPLETLTTSANGLIQWTVPVSRDPSACQFFRARPLESIVTDPSRLATINVNNYDRNMPIYFQGQLASGDVKIELLAGPPGGGMHRVFSSDLGHQDIFPLSEPGYFYGGIGIVEGVYGGQVAQFQLRAWLNAPSYDSATYRGASAVFQQATGNWNSVGVPPQVPMGPALQIPAALVIQ